MKWSLRILLACIVLLVTLWCVGIALSDRWGWSQWLAWIPSCCIVVLLLILAVVAKIQKKQIIALGLFVCSCVLALYCLVIEHRFFHASSCQGTISIVGWTMSHSKKDVSVESADIIVALDADITLLTHGWYVRGEESIADWMQVQGHRITSGPFTLFTKFKPIKVQSLVASDGIYISQFVLDTTDVLGEELVVWAIDLPSSLASTKMTIANKVVHLLKVTNASSPDIVLGDFNMTRNSVAMRTMFPTLHDAACDGGSGVIGTFPMNFPLYHIDHILLAPTFHACSYICVNPHIGRHQMQVATIR